LTDEAARAIKREIDCWRARQFRDFAGATVDVRVPLSEQLLNDLVQQHVLPRVRALRSLALRLEDENRLTVRLESARLSWLPAVTVPLEVESDLRLASGAVARLHIRGSGIAASLAPLMRFITLPDGVRLVDNVIEIDITSLLPPIDRPTLLEWLRHAHITTTEGTLWVEVRLALETDGPP
jgi:hypothetical protein